MGESKMQLQFSDWQKAEIAQKKDKVWRKFSMQFLNKNWKLASLKSLINYV